MKFSEAWLREWVDPRVDSDTLCNQLSMAGLEVDAVAPVAPEFSGVVVAQVLTVEQHPDADKLRVCQVEVGSGVPLQIICGAPNVAAGMKVPTALVGALLPGNLRIKRAKLRGVESVGMICSATELGLADTSSGILPLPEDAPVGKDVRAYLKLDDRTIELNVTPDRGDCFSLAGIAREVGVINRSAVTGPSFVPVPPHGEDRFPVRVLAEAACPRYVCRIIRGLNPQASTPLWMLERLRRSGLRGIHPVVDVTNYVLLELGQPMHGFDLSRLDREIQVRMAAPGESLALLNGTEIALGPDSLVIADANQPVALAGIMGGGGSAVTTDTRDVLLESAFFAPMAILGKARTYGLHTDSSHRFERGVDPELQIRALERATQLLRDIAGGEPGPVVEAAAPSHIPGRKSVYLRRQRITRLLGVAVDAVGVADILTRLGMTLTETADGWAVTPPSNRFDIAIEADLIEEIGRIYGYQNIPMTHARAAATTRAPAETTFDLHRAKQVLVDRGFHEVVTYSFVSPELQVLVDPEHRGIGLANPISADMSVMRTSLWPGLLQTAAQNRARQQERVRIFESGLRFHDEQGEIRQQAQLAALVCGSALDEQWGTRFRPVDFFDLKADLAAVVGLAGAADAISFAPATHVALHPGQAARILRTGEPIGWIGMLHPALRAKLDFADDVFLFEIALAALEQGVLPGFKPLSKFPAIRRDIAVVVDRDLSYRELHECVQAAAPELLQRIVLFDVYTGDGINSGRKSLALGLILQASSQTLTDEEVDRVVHRVLERLSTRLGAVLRA